MWGSRTASSEERGSRGGWLYSKVVEPLVGMVRSVFTQGLTPELMSLSLAFGMIRILHGLATPLPCHSPCVSCACLVCVCVCVCVGESGVTGGLFPVPGVTTIVCGLFVYLFGLNLAACQLMNVLLVRSVRSRRRRRRAITRAHDLFTTHH